MPLELYITSPNYSWDAIQRILGQRSATKKHLPSEKSGFSIIFAKDPPGKIVWPPKISPWSITTLPVQLSKRPTDPTNAFVENERQI